MRSRRRVAILLDTSRGWDAGLMRGVARYSNLHNPWEFLRPALSPYQLFAGYRFASDNPDESLRALLKQRADGVLLHESELARKLRQKRVATIVIPTNPMEDKSCYVVCDNQGAGRTAAEHLLSLGVRRFAYVGFANTLWSEARSAAFRHTLAEKGYAVEEHLVPLLAEDRDKPNLHRKLAHWLKGLPKPCGLFAGNDDLARAVVETCNLVEIRVPDHLAVVGADNDELICELSSPPLSSVPFALEKAGYEAAELLDRVMEGLPIEKNYVQAVAQPVVVRVSTDYVAIEDQEVARALRYIRDNAGRMIQVKDVVRATRLSHRTLHNRFKHEVGHSLVKEINRRRAQFIAGLLTETTLSLGQIAMKIGFPSDAHLVRFFRREIGETPGAYRRRLA